MKCTVFSPLWSCLKAQLVFGLSSALFCVLIMLLQDEVCLEKLSSNKSIFLVCGRSSSCLGSLEWRSPAAFSACGMCGADASSTSEGQSMAKHGLKWQRAARPTLRPHCPSLQPCLPSSASAVYMP